jgi:2-keto-4-pentenoate hydratase/2-oxohepta-3-ene-1,7-dioic acid hydratase in catechol pathway
MMYLYCTSDGIARRDGEDLLVLDLPQTNLTELLRDGIAKAATAAVRSRIPMARAELLVPLALPRHVVIAGGNYHDHLAEAGLPIPAQPVFVIAGGDMVIGPHSPIVLPGEAPDHVD